MIFTTETLLWLGYATYFCAQLAVGAHILFTKHEEPSSALLWLLIITIFPVVGLLMYSMFGINRLKSMGMSVHAFAEQLEASKEKYLGKAVVNYLSCLKTFSAGMDEHGKTFARTLKNLLPECRPFKGNNLELLCDGTAAYPRMLDDIHKAKHSIRMQSFIIMNDPVGREIFDALAKRAEHGVDVKVLYDSFGSAKAYFSYFFHRYTHQRLKNLKIRAFSPINIFTPWRIQLRNHRKLLVIDGKVAFIGGINISEDNARFSKVPRRKYIHDLHCRITGPAVSELQFVFLKDWMYSTKGKISSESLLGDFPVPEAQGDDIIRVVNSGPGQNPEASQSVFFTAAATAQKSLWIMTPYFVPGRSFIKALCITAARGVDVKIIVPKNNNHVFVALASQSLYRTLLSHGVKIYNKDGIFSHAKAMIVDGEWGFMGSSNCDVRSFKLNYELDFCVESGIFIDKLYKQFEFELTESEEILLENVHNSSLSKQLLENICALMSPVL